MRKTKFLLEPLNNTVFEGFALEEEWNGWACPYFTYDEAKKIVEAQKLAGGQAWYDSNSDEFVFDIHEERETFSPVVIEGRKLYPVGNGSWIWEESEAI